MLALIVILFIIGIVLLLLPVPLANADQIGWLFVGLAIILLIVVLLLGALDGSDLSLDTGGGGRRD